ncbi:alpha/beta fold hydrolase [Bacteriovoracaceae bacterium]|mgnify:CR=1 FL=1|nr:alpha/beta fold hydrolase [Bacteriovoracaceae bacterium]|tara:strand:+ start:95733 stop:96758 length:1026 start_codon:yes stop_codon:yes gene_type:complete
MPFDGSTAVKIEEQLSFEEKIKASLNLYQSEGQSTFLPCDGPHHIHYRSFVKKNSLALVVISPGRSESSIKYSELIYDLWDLPFDFLVLDHRGQGFSSRLCHNPLKGHVQKFDDYSRDLQHVLDDFIEKNKKTYKFKFLFAHSMGSLIGLGAQLKNNDLFQAAFISSPMLKIETGRVPETSALFLASALTFAGKGEKKVYEIRRTEKDFDDNPLTRNKKRFNMMRELLQSFPQLIHGPPTIQWLKESIRAGRTIWRNRKKIRIPIMLLQAGKDALVDNSRQDKFCRDLPNCKILKFKDAKHEIFQEEELLRAKALVQLREFLKEQSGLRSKQKSKSKNSSK